MKRIVWRPAARADRIAIMAHIASDNWQAAIELDEEFEDKAALAPANPLIYKTGRAQGTREIVVRPHYVMVYRVTRQAIEILRVLHTARRWPAKRAR